MHRIPVLRVVAPQVVVNVGWRGTLGDGRDGGGFGIYWDWRVWFLLSCLWFCCFVTFMLMAAVIVLGVDISGIVLSFSCWWSCLPVNGWCDLGNLQTTNGTTSSSSRMLMFWWWWWWSAEVGMQKHYGLRLVIHVDTLSEYIIIHCLKFHLVWDPWLNFVYSLIVLYSGHKRGIKVCHFRCMQVWFGYFI